jgi:PKD repeat protein
MASKFKQGDSVTQILPAPISGVVAGFSLDQVSGEVHVKVEFTDADGSIQTRDFLETDLASA